MNYYNVCCESGYCCVFTAILCVASFVLGGLLMFLVLY